MSERFAHKRAFEVASFKAADPASGQFEALVSVFGNIDLGGDRVVKGAFAKSLARWDESGDPIPVIWNHMWDNPEAHIGKVAPGDAAETDDGLLVKGQLDMDNPFAAQVYRLLAERRVKEFSFGYSVTDAERKDGALNLLDLDLFEVGPTLKGMNPATELLAVKALADVTADMPLVDAKAGARFSKSTLAAVQAHVDALTGAADVLKSHFFAADGEEVETPKSDEAKAIGKASDPDADLRTQIQIAMEN
jgi:HK97 family phage prohead protease